MSRLEYADGTVVWRRSLMAKVLWVGAVGAFPVMALFLSDASLRREAPFLVVAAGLALLAWGRVWRPHLAATPAGLIVRRATSAVPIRWEDITGATVSRWGVVIHVRDGQVVVSSVPYQPRLPEDPNERSEAEDAVALIEDRARRAADLS